MFIASERLADAEASASTDHRRAQRDTQAFHSFIYPPGSEFALCQAETQLMGAVVGVLNESLTESIKGFYKLRKAYTTLDNILAAEVRYMRSRQGISADTPAHHSVDSLSSVRSASSAKGMPGIFDGGTRTGQTSAGPTSVRAAHSGAVTSDSHKEERANAAGEEDDDEFYDAEEDISKSEAPPTYTGHIEIDGIHKKLDKISLGDDEERPTSRDLNAPVTMPIRHGLLDHDPDSDIFANPIDIFIHSGANLCFGLLLILISMIPPAFGKLLFIIGFHGDKERGVRMLWQASKFHNINGAMAGLIILGYYNTLVGFSDIIPERNTSGVDKDSVEGYPKERCEALLADMRRRHPKSHLWLLEEARMQAANKHLANALELLETTDKSTLKQVEALEMFETSLNAMYIHNYDLCSKSFVKCVSLNNWSHALYYYIAGAAEVELYRKHKISDPKAAAVYAESATKFLKQAPQHAGKKRFMARQLPFDVFVIRKLRKWEARANEWNVPLIDAIGVSPLEEMIFFWNGYKRMDPSQLRYSQDSLAWSDNVTTNRSWSRESTDEKAILALLRGAVLRNLRQWDEARQMIKHGVLDLDRLELKGGLRDDWTAPSAHYEMGVICWMQRVEAAAKGVGRETEEKWVKECEVWVEKAAKWESYELDARIGMKIATAQDTLRSWKEKAGLAVKA